MWLPNFLAFSTLLLNIYRHAFVICDTNLISVLLSYSESLALWGRPGTPCGYAPDFGPITDDSVSTEGQPVFVWSYLLKMPGPWEGVVGEQWANLSCWPS